MKAEKDNLPPRDAWLLECVQYDPNNPLPCTPEEIKKFPNGQAPIVDQPVVDSGAPIPTSDEAGAGSDDDLLQKMLGGGGGTVVEGGKSEEDELLDKMLNVGKDAGKDSGAGAKKLTPDEELLQQMLGK